MAYETENTLEKRVARVKAAVNHKEGDRVPFTPKVNLIYGQFGNCNPYEALMDLRNLKEGARNFLTRYEVDLFWTPGDYPSNVMEVLGTTAIHWPGATWDLERTRSYQVCDNTYLKEDEWEEFLFDPSHFFMTKVWPRRHAKLSGLAKMSFQNVVEFGHYASMAQFADPEVRNTLITLMAAGDEAVKYIQAQAELGQVALETQTPLGVVIGTGAPYDFLADNLRGYLNLPMDLFEEPEKVKAGIDVMTKFALDVVDQAAAMKLDYLFMPLHGGTDDFMDEDTYKEFYLPSLRKVLEHELELGITPFMFFEGKYNTRLEILRDEFPAGCIGMFEQVDIAKAKKILQGHMCITGNIPGASLAYGKPEDIVEMTKKMLDDCAPGGGFMMDCSIVMDHCNEACFDAWYETTMKYGNY
jgi:hypothetical protein